MGYFWKVYNCLMFKVFFEILKPGISYALNFRESVHIFSVFFFSGFRVWKKVTHIITSHILQYA